MGFHDIHLTLPHFGVLLAALLCSTVVNSQRFSISNNSVNVSNLVTPARSGQTTPAPAQGPPYDDATPTLNCTQCTGRDLKRSYRLESIKTDILRKLRLSAPPNTTGKRFPNVPLLNRMIDQLSIDESSTDSTCDRPVVGSDPDEDRMTTMRVIQFSKPDEAQVPPAPMHASGFIYFRLPSADIRQSSQVVRANLGLYIRSIANTTSATPSSSSSSSSSSSASFVPSSIMRNSRFTWILVYRLGEPHRVGGPSGPLTQDRVLFRRKKVQLTAADTGQWFHFDMNMTVQRWIERPEQNHGILVHVSDGRGEPLAVTTPRNDVEESHLPYLEIETLSQPSADRLRRAFDLNCDESSAELRCCRYPLVVDFEAFGWDWIIVPKRYSAFYCSGECPFLYYQQNAHGHMVQQAKPDGSGMPCCAPKRVSSISMLYYDDSMNIVYGRLPGMVVDRCGCA